jgi:hypothetical protein
MKTSELTGAALDWAVAKCEGVDVGEPIHLTYAQEFKLMHDEGDLNYSSSWAQGGPIIEREGIVVALCKKHGWVAVRELWYLQDAADHALCSTGETYLIAAMRCYVASQLGDEVEIPEELK